jgi:hypothetical protein
VFNNIFFILNWSTKMQMFWRDKVTRPYLLCIRIDWFVSVQCLDNAAVRMLGATPTRGRHLCRARARRFAEEGLSRGDAATPRRPVVLRGAALSERTSPGTMATASAGDTGSRAEAAMRAVCRLQWAKTASSSVWCDAGADSGRCLEVEGEATGTPCRRGRRGFSGDVANCEQKGRKLMR